MMQEYYIPDTAGLRVTYKGTTYTLAEDIQYHTDDSYDAPVEPYAQVVGSDESTIVEINWWFSSLDELDNCTDFSTHISGVITTSDD